MAKQKEAWDKLSMLEKALLIKLSVDNGVSSLKLIRDTYNLYSSGGKKQSAVNRPRDIDEAIEISRNTPYNKNIDDVEGPGYREYMWKLAQAKSKVWGISPEEAYDSFIHPSEFNYRRWYNLASQDELDNTLTNGDAHWMDVFGKTVGADTFSNESPYSGYVNPYNPKGITGGTWTGRLGIDEYIPSESQIDNNWPLNKAWFAIDRGNKYYQEKISKGEDTHEVPSIMTYNNGVMLPEITVTPRGNYIEYSPYANGGYLAHKYDGELLGETQYLKLDDAANYKAYEDATNYFLNLGFGPELASKYAIYKVHNNMTFDAGLLPEVDVIALAWGNGDNTSRMKNYQNALKSKREAILNIELAAFNLNIRNATDKWGKGIGLGMTALAALPVASGAMAGINALRASYPIATGLWDAYWAGDGIVRNLFSDSGVKKTYNLIKEGDTWGALKSGAGDALDLLGVADIFSLGNKIINPLYRSAHAYNTIPQFGYQDTLSRFKNWSKAVLSGTDPNVMNEALWVEGLRKLLQTNNMSGMPYLSALADINKDAAIEIAVRGRDEASRLYNHLPSRHLYYIPNGDGSYRYNLEKIQQDWKQLSGEDYFPLPTAEFYDEALATLGHHGWDVITGAGGNLTANSFLGKTTVGDIYSGGEEFGIKLIEDVQDAHPFKRGNRQFSNWLQRSVLDKVSEKIRNKANTIYTKLFDLTNKGLDYGSTKLNRFWYNYLGGRPLNKLRYETNLQLPGYIKEGITRKPGPFWQKVNTTMSDFEVGSLTGATPFLMRTEVPYTRTSSLVSGKDIPYFVDDKIILGHHSDKYFIPAILDPYSIQRVDNFLQFNVPDFTNLKSTGGPLYPFSFEKNPFLKTPVVRYDEGGHLFGFGDWLLNLFNTNKSLQLKLLVEDQTWQSLPDTIITTPKTNLNADISSIANTVTPGIHTDMLTTRGGFNTFNKFNIGDNDIYAVDKENKLFIPLDKKLYIDNMRPRLDYIGGDKDLTRKQAIEVFGLWPSIVDVANLYLLSPDLLARRLSKEGFLDTYTDRYNQYSNKELQKTMQNNPQLFWDSEVNSYNDFGLDTVLLDYIDGNISILDLNVKEFYDDLIKNNKYTQGSNEKDDATLNFNGSVLQLFHLQAAYFKYLESIYNARRKLGLYENIDLDTFLNAAYNLGIYNDDLQNAEWVNKNYKVPSWYTK